MGTLVSVASGDSACGTSDRFWQKNSKFFVQITLESYFYNRFSLLPNKYLIFHSIRAPTCEIRTKIISAPVPFALPKPVAPESVTLTIESFQNFK